MANITLIQAAFLSTGLTAAGANASVPFAEARREIAIGRAKWQTPALVQHWRNVDFSQITSVSGAGLQSLDSILIADETTGKTCEVFITGEDQPRRYRIVAIGALVVDGDRVIAPPDSDATVNNRVLEQIS